MAGLLTSLLTGRPIGATYQPWDDFWFNPLSWGGATAAGTIVSPESSLRLSAVYACVGLLSDMVGVLPLPLYRRLDNGGKERAKSHYLYNLLHRQPNVRQTAKEWRTMGQAHLLLRGNFYNLLEFDARGRITQLVPLHPDRVMVELLDNGRRGYLYRPPKGNPQRFTQDEMLHVMGLTLDGIRGVSVIEYARESLGRAQAEDGFAAAFWRNYAEPGGTLTYPGSLNPTTKANLKKEWREAHAGANRGTVAILDAGLKFEQLTVKPRDAQFIESRQFSVADIARWFRVPPFMIGDVERSTSWGTGLEQQTIGFVNFTLMPWLVSFEQAIDRDLIIEDDFFAEFLVDALLRGDMLARAQAYSIYIQNGVMAENEVRVRENLNPVPGLDEPRRSANQDRGGDPRGPRAPGPAQPPARRPPADEEDGDEAGANAFARVVVHEAAERLVRKEIAAIRTWAPRFQADREGWTRWIAEFYGRHAEVLVRELRLPVIAAREYGSHHCAEVLDGGLTVLDGWEEEAPAQLARLALGEATS